MKPDALLEQEQLEQEICRFARDPLGFVRFAYPWGEDGRQGSAGPRKWQADILSAVGTHLRNPATRFQPCLIAVASGHGIGKDAMASWLINWGQSTCVDCKVVVTANTEPQLRTKSIPEVAKWTRQSINKHWWNVEATSIKSRARKHAKTWRTDFLTWSEDNTEAFQGLHNEGKRIIVVFTEASGIADKVWETTEGALTDENTEIIWLALGNPTKPTGRFFECFNKFRHRWKTFQIDARTVEGTNKDQLDKWIQDYGEDSDFVRVRVRGEFPRAGSNQFIPSDAVAKCRKYKAVGYDKLPIVMSVDVARFGDDQSVVLKRQGRHVEILAKHRGLDTVELTNKIVELYEKHEPDGIVVDGDGIGAGVVDQLRHRRYEVHEFHGGQRPIDGAKYYNRRAEVWGLMKDAIEAEVQLPDDPEMETDLTGIQYGFSAKQQIQLEKKDDMKSRGLASPDLGDALAMSYAVQVNHRNPRPAIIYNDFAKYGEHAWMNY